MSLPSVRSIKFHVTKYLYWHTRQTQLSTSFISFVVTNLPAMRLPAASCIQQTTTCIPNRPPILTYRIGHQQLELNGPGWSTANTGEINKIGTEFLPSSFSCKFSSFALSGLYPDGLGFSLSHSHSAHQEGSNYFRSLWTQLPNPENCISASYLLHSR